MPGHENKKSKDNNPWNKLQKDLDWYKYHNQRCGNERNRGSRARKESSKPIYYLGSKENNQTLSQKNLNILVIGRYIIKSSFQKAIKVQKRNKRCERQTKINVEIKVVFLYNICVCLTLIKFKLSFYSSNSFEIINNYFVRYSSRSSITAKTFVSFFVIFYLFIVKILKFK